MTKLISKIKTQLENFADVNEKMDNLRNKEVTTENIEEMNKAYDKKNKIRKAARRITDEMIDEEIQNFQKQIEELNRLKFHLKKVRGI